MESDKTHPGKKPRKSSLAGGVKFVAFVAVAFFVGSNLDSIMAFFGVSFDGVETSPWILVPIMVLSLLFVLSFHEAGHILGGKLVGFRFLLFVVGPIKISGSEGGLRFAVNRSLAMAGGLGGAAPTDSRNLLRRMMVYVAGGPVASFVLAAAGLGVAVVSPPSVGIVAGVMGLTSFLIGAVTLIPNRTGGFTSDGSRLLMLRRGGEEAERWAALSALGGSGMAGIRPRDLDRKMVETSLSPEDDTPDEAGARSTAHYYFLDIGDVDTAEAILEPATNIEGAPEAIRTQILLEAAFLHAFFHHDGEKARDLASGAKPGKAMDESLPLRVEAAMLLAEGDEKGARAKATKSLAALGKSLVPGTAKLEREWLEKIIEASGERSPKHEKA